MDFIIQLNSTINSFVWGPPMLVLLVGTGVYLTFRTNFFSILKLGYVLKNTLFKIFAKGQEGEGEITAFQAVATALAATVGTGNIAGVATAIALGGPGAVFWMWLSAFFGMASKFSEITLGIKYRERMKDGSVAGGAMYYLDKGLHSKFLSYFFSIMVIIAYFIMGAVVDTNSVALSVQEQWGIQPIITGVVLKLSNIR